MITKVYSVFDMKAAVYGVPFFMPNRAMAERAFEDLAKDPKSLVSRHPADFQLYEIGDFNDATAELIGSEPVAVVSASALVVNGSKNAVAVAH